jgi:hypothetical protein
MANMLIPVEERELTPAQVDALDRRRRRGQTLINVGFQAVGRPGCDVLAGMGAPDAVLGHVSVYGRAGLHRGRHPVPQGDERVFQLLEKL